MNNPDVTEKQTAPAASTPANGSVRLSNQKIFLLAVSAHIAVQILGPQEGYKTIVLPIAAMLWTTFVAWHWNSK